LWDTIAACAGSIVPDPTAAWRDHLAALNARSDQLNARRYSALRFSGPGT
jgi:aminopeptidase